MFIFLKFSKYDAFNLIQQNQIKDDIHLVEMNKVLKNEEQ